jgi:hypothetical protein
MQHKYQLQYFPTVCLLVDFLTSQSLLTYFKSKEQCLPLGVVSESLVWKCLTGD